MFCGSFVLFLVVVAVVVVIGSRSLRLFGLALQFTVNFSSALTSDIEAWGMEEIVVVDAPASRISLTVLSAWGVDLIGDVLAVSIAESISPEVPIGQGATTLAMRSRLARVGDNRLTFGWRETCFCSHLQWSLTLRDHKSLRVIPAARSLKYPFRHFWVEFRENCKMTRLLLLNSGLIHCNSHAKFLIFLSSGILNNM